jgi:hypothetical protein
MVIIIADFWTSLAKTMSPVRTLSRYEKVFKIDYMFS